MPAARRITSSRHLAADGWIFPPAHGPMDQDFGDVTSLVNALRNRGVYRLASLRLLADLAAVMRGAVRDRGAATPAIGVGMLESDYYLVRRAAQASPCLFRALQPSNVLLRRFGAAPEVHRILLVERPALGAPVAALAHLLAAAVARQFDEIAVAAVLERGVARVQGWTGATAMAPFSAATYADLVAQAVRRARPARRRDRTVPTSRRPLFLHLIVAAPSTPGELPAAFARPRRFTSAGRLPANPVTDGYDRILYLSDRVPSVTEARRWTAALTRAACERVPEAPRRDRAAVGPDGPFFCSFVPTLVEGTDGAGPLPFDTAPVDEEWQVPRAERVIHPHWRLHRDACAVRFDLARIRRTWDGRARGGAAAATAALLRTPGVRPLADRWARSVTNRTAGVALSGGGAASYSLIPILRGIHRQIPIDVVSGVSGGTLLGAYYCRDGLVGLARCLDRGRDFGPATLAEAALSADSFRRRVDADLGGTRVDGTGVRLIALTTALPASGPPAAHVVTRGTLGEAVQVSGAAPVLFAPIDKDTSRGRVRFADGATAAFIPARILRDAGADVVFAFNCLPGPRKRNPLDTYAGGSFAYEHTPAGRFVDLWIAASYLAQRIGRETDEDAHVYFEPEDADMPLVSSFNFANGGEFVEASKRSKRVGRCIRECIETWSAFRRWT